MANTFSITSYLAKQQAGIKQRAKLIAYAIAAMFALEISDIFLPARFSLDQFGVHPREFLSLLHIPLYPWLHNDFGHLIDNAAPLFILGLIISLTSWRRLLEVTLCSTLVSGLGIFIFGASGTNHIGASGIVAGYLAYLLVRGYVERKPLIMLVSIGVGFFYLLEIMGLFIPRSGVSWTAHAFGFCGGALAAWLLAPKHEKALLNTDPTLP
jgi:membrane associated rhomboid family serine protease